MTDNTTTMERRAPAVSARGVFEEYVTGASAVYRATGRALRPLRPVTRLWIESPRVLGPVWRWVTVPDAFRELREQQLRPSQYQREWAVLARAVVIRSILAAAAAVPVLWLVALVAMMAGPLWWVALLAIAAGAGWIGGKLPRRQVEAVEDAPAVEDAGAATLRTALTRSVPAIAAKLREHPDALRIGREVEDGNGYKRKVTLPIGVSASTVAKYVEDIAGGLDVAANRVIISARPDGSPREAEVWVAADVLDKLPDPRWALAHAQRFTLTKPIPLGETLKGEPVAVTLAGPGGSVLLAGKSGSGKTTTMRALLAAAVLDPRATIAVCDLKDAGDYDSLSPALDWYQCRNNDATLSALAVMLTQAVAHMERVMASRVKNPAPTVVAIDEAQNCFAEPQHRKVIEPLLKRLVKEGRAAGIVLILATQKPTSDAMPTAVRDMLGSRICHRVEEFVIAQAALGTAANKPGREFDKLTNGQAYISDEKRPYDGMVRVAYVTEEAAGTIARAHPRDPGQLFPIIEDDQAAAFPAYPADVEPSPVQDPEPAPEPDPFLIDVQAAFPEGRDRALCGELAVRLAPIRAEFAPDDDEDQGRARARAAARVTAALRDAGVEARKIRVGKTTGIGVFRQWVEDALNGPQDGPQDVAGGVPPEQPEHGTP